MHINNYERQGIIGKTFNFPRLAFLNFFTLLPFNLGVRLFIKSSKHTNRIRKYARTFKALELMYSYKGLNFHEGVLEGIISWFWECMILNPAALRNRLKLMKTEFTSAINLMPNKKISVLSLASGSGRGIAEILGELKDKIAFEVTFVDRSSAAHNYCIGLAEEMGIKEKSSWIKEDLETFLANNSKQDHDIIEMVGFLDYLDKTTAVKLIRKIYFSLNKGGYLISANVKDNSEKRFLDGIVSWKMVYRNEEDLRNLLLASGFSGDSIKVMYEPLNVHGLIVAKK